MNKIIIIGALGRDPELKSTKDGIPVCTFSVAVNNKDKSTTWFRVTAWRQLGELCAKYLKKGAKAAIVGSVTLNTFTGADGQNKANLEINADSVEFLSGKDEQKQETADERSGFVQVDEELPF